MKKSNFLRENVLEYKIKCDIDAEKISVLRESVGWNKMLNSIKKSLPKYYNYIFCFDDKELVGFIDIISDGTSDAYLQDLMVKPKYQGKGIGTKLMTMSIDLLKKDGIYCISILFEEKLYDFYKRFNFNRIAAGQIETREKV